LRITNGHDTRRYAAAIAIVAALLVSICPVLNDPVQAEAIIARPIEALPIATNRSREASDTRARWSPALLDVDPCSSPHNHVHMISSEFADDNTPWTASDIVSGEDLSKVISSSRGVKPVILQVGIEGLYREAHIPDAIFAGPAAEPEGLTLLKAKAKPIARTREIVIYCGCCPWRDCPNIRPAFVALKQMGFKKVKLLDIPTDFHQDWINKGFPTVRS
jgi:hypothetical protein